MEFHSGAIPHINDKAGREAFKKAVIADIKKLGGKPKESQGLASLRSMRSALKAKMPVKSKTKSVVTPETEPATKSKKK